ncbi:hypothetical protein EVAR_53526_1 [Eumeta japonica]|uniref:Uncharacterized protein n=1 Tax=Eumeta variegata TaxID=151549 RepID=A0A4C1Y7R6_EUMVA|nr:hypothetical protein EVAR_53526_1 [Eumeta japonica]
MTHIPSWLSSLPMTFPYCASLPSHLLAPIRPQIATDYSNSAPAPLHNKTRPVTSGGHSREIEVLQCRGSQADAAVAGWAGQGWGASVVCVDESESGAPALRADVDDDGLTMEGQRRGEDVCGSLSTTTVYRVAAAARARMPVRARCLPTSTHVACLSRMSVRVTGVPF